MIRMIHLRDFTICKAVALVGLIGLALMLGGVPKHAPDLVQTTPEGHKVVPVILMITPEPCVPCLTVDL